MSWHVIELQELRQKQGLTLVGELEHITKGLFDAARRLTIITNDTEKEIKRGGHRFVGEKQQILICTKGRALVSLHSVEKCGEVVLDNPKGVLIIPKDIWTETAVEPNSTIIALTSTNFSENESAQDKPCSH